MRRLGASACALLGLLGAFAAMAAGSTGSETPAPVATTAAKSGMTWSAAATQAATQKGIQYGKQQGAAATLPKNVVVGIITDPNEAATRAVNASEEAVRLLGWKYITCAGMLNPATTGPCFLSMYNRGARVLIANSTSATLFAATRRELLAKHVLMFNDAGSVPDPGDYAGSYAPNDAALTVAEDKFLFAEMAKHHQTTLAVQYNSTLPALAARYVQFKKDLAKHPNIKVVASNVTDLSSFANSLTTSVRTVLTANPSVSAYWTSIGGEPELLVNVAQSVLHGKPLPIITGIYGDIAALADVRAGTITAVVDSPLEEGGWFAIDQAAEKLARGRTPQANPPYPFPAEPAEVITKANLPAAGSYFTPKFDYVAFFKAKWKQEFGK